MPSTHFNRVYGLNYSFIRISIVLLAAVSLFAVARGASTGTGQTFSSPEDAVNALAVAVAGGDTNALAAIFGPGSKDIRSSDPVEGQREMAAFSAALNTSNHLDYVEDDRCILEVGADQWAFPIPLVRTNDTWYFDTQAGKDEILNRRIGYNELQTLQALRTAVEAQREYASEDHNGDGVLEFAEKFISSPGKKDGLYWSPDIDGEISPLGPAVADAQNQGYLKKIGTGTGEPAPFHGYYFKILTRQGKHAPIGAYNYIINDHLIGGFAFVAWPSQYGESGVMTFIVNQDGKVYQKDLGPDTESIVKKMKAYDPGPGWALSSD